MDKITIKHLEGLRDAIARELGRPNGPSYTRRDGRNVATVGKLIVEKGSAMYGNAWALCELMNEQGGESSILRAGTARELFDQMHAYLRGIQDGRRTP